MTAIVKRIVLVLLFLGVVAALYSLPLTEWLSVLAEWGRNHPIAGPAIYVVFVVLATMLFLPGSIAMMISGYLFGFLPGFLFAAVAIPLGAQGAFELARWVARPWVRKKIDGDARIHAIEVALAEEAMLIVILTRLSLVVPFNLLNYMYGATSVKAFTYFVATAIGMLPAVALYVYLGTLARDLGQILSGDAAPPELGYWIFGVGIIAVIVVTWFVHRIATKALNKHLAEDMNK